MHLLCVGGVDVVKSESEEVGHTIVQLSLAARIIVVIVVDLLPSFWAAQGCKTGIELVLT